MTESPEREGDSNESRSVPELDLLSRIMDTSPTSIVLVNRDGKIISPMRAQSRFCV